MVYECDVDRVWMLGSFHRHYPRLWKMYAQLLDQGKGGEKTGIIPICSSPEFFLHFDFDLN